MPLAIDELPLVALLGSFAEGETVVSGAAELRHKESDRIASVVAGLSALGAEIEAAEDGFIVTGAGRPAGAAGSTPPVIIGSRCSGAIAGLASRGGVDVEGVEAAGVSYPGSSRTWPCSFADGRLQFIGPGNLFPAVGGQCSPAHREAGWGHLVAVAGVALAGPGREQEE